MANTARHLSADPKPDLPQARRPPVKRRRNAAKTRDDMLAAAAQRFARSGYSHVTLQEIADDIGVTPALIVRYFGSKLALFEEVARNQPLLFPPLAGGDLQTQMEARARAILGYFEDRNARAPGIALIRSLDLDEGQLFRAELERRIVQPWASEIAGDDADMRSRLIAGLLMGAGLFALGALTEPDKPPLEPEDAARFVHYLAKMLAACVEA